MNAAVAFHGGSDSSTPAKPPRKDRKALRKRELVRRLQAAMNLAMHASIDDGHQGLWADVYDLIRQIELLVDVLVEHEPPAWKAGLHSLSGHVGAVRVLVRLQQKQEEA